jgi:hypothetical protein
MSRNPLSLAVILMASFLSVGMARAEDSKLNQTAREIGHSIGTAAREVGEGAKKAGKEIGKAGKKVGQAAAEGGKEVARAFKGKADKDD